MSSKVYFLVVFFLYVGRTFTMEGVQPYNCKAIWDNYLVLVDQKTLDNAFIFAIEEVMDCAFMVFRSYGDWGWFSLRETRWSAVNLMDVSPSTNSCSL